LAFRYKKRDRLNEEKGKGGKANLIVLRKREEKRKRSRIGQSPQEANCFERRWWNSIMAAVKL